MANAPSNANRLSDAQRLAISRALADPKRFAILQQIAAHDALPCTALEMHDQLSPATISHHLKELQGAGLLRMEREGRGIRLSLQREVWRAYLQELNAL